MSLRCKQKSSSNNNRKKTMETTVKSYKVTTSWGTTYNVFARNQKEAKEMVANQYLQGVDYKREILQERLGQYNAENEEKISLGEYISLSSESDPNFFGWLFESNRALIDDNGQLTERGKEAYLRFANDL